MTRQILFFISLLMSAIAHGQVESNHRWDNVSIYEYGIPLSSCEDNFENLFRNWPKWVTNHQQTKLLSYKFIETLKDSSTVQYYAKKLHGWKSLTCRKTGSYDEKSNADTTIIIRELNIYITPWEKILEEIGKDLSKEEFYHSEMKLKFKLLQQHFQNTVNIGDEVYNIKLKVEGTKYNHYVICRPKENKVVFDNLFLEINEIRYRLDNRIPSK